MPFGPQFILCWDHPLFWDTPAIATVQDSQDFWCLFLSLNHSHVIGSCALPHPSPKLSRPDSQNFVCVYKVHPCIADAMLVRGFGFCFYYILNCKMWKVLILFCCPNAVAFQSCLFYFRAVLVVAWALKAGRSFHIPVVLWLLAPCRPVRRHNPAPGPRQPPHLPDSPKDSGVNSYHRPFFFFFMLEFSVYSLSPCPDLKGILYRSASFLRT